MLPTPHHNRLFSFAAHDVPSRQNTHDAQRSQTRRDNLHYPQKHQSTQARQGPEKAALTAMMGMPGPPVAAAEASGAKSEMEGEISALTPSTPWEKSCPRLRRTAIRRRAFALAATWTERGHGYTAESAVASLLDTPGGRRTKITRTPSGEFVPLAGGVIGTIHGEQSNNKLASTRLRSRRAERESTQQRNIHLQQPARKKSSALPSRKKSRQSLRHRVPRVSDGT